MKSFSAYIPILRFPEFHGEWNQISLRDAVEFENGKAHENEIVEDGHFIVVNSKFISSRGSIKKYSNKQMSPVFKHDVVMVMSDVPKGQALAKCFYIDKDNLYTLNQRICALRANGYDSRFLFYLIDRNRYFLAFDSGVGQTNLRKDEVLDCPLNVPESRDEQYKVGVFLATVDEKIGQLTVKHALLVRYKKGVMQQIFDQKTRFKKDDGEDFPDWEEKRLGDVATFTKGSGISKEETDPNGLHECIRYGELYTHYGETIDKIISRTNLGKSGLVFSKENDVIIPSSGETNIDIARAAAVQRKGIALGGDLTIIRSNINAVFLSYYLNSKKKYDIARLAQGVSVVHLYPNHLAILRIEIPSAEEQRLIAGFFSSVDKKIALVIRQIDRMKTFKEGLLQQMFV